VNEGYKQSYGGGVPQSEAVHPFGGDVYVDRSSVDLQGPEAPRRQVEMKVRSKRLTPGTDMALSNGGGALDFDKLDELIDSVARQTVGQGDYNVEVLGYGEAGGTSSIYCCTFGDQAVTGLQGPFQGRYGISVRDLGEVPDGPVFRTRIDWYVGFGRHWETSTWTGFRARSTNSAPDSGLPLTGGEQGSDNHATAVGGCNCSISVRGLMAEARKP
jgi:hypothetical protein